MLREQRVGLAAGVAVGLLWSAGKVSGPKLTSLAVDRAVLGTGSLWFWSLSIAVVAVIAGIFTAWRRCSLTSCDCTWPTTTTLRRGS